MNELKRLIDCSVNITGREVWADRTSVYDKYINRGNGAWIVRYNLRGNNKGMDTNRLVYELMIMAGHDMLDCCAVVYGGDYTAAELAGTAGYISEFLGDAKKDWETYASIVIEAGGYQCEFPARDVFKMMTEWEGVAGITAKQAYRFPVEGKERPKDMKLKSYKRGRVYSQKRVSVAKDEKRINAKFEMLGHLYQNLTSEGMRKALSLLTAVESAKKMYSAEHADMAKTLMTYWFWKQYRSEESPYCIDPFTAKGFECGPECWKVVDEDYVKELLARWKEFVAANPAPTWLKKDDMVQLKNQAVTPKRWQGKLKVYRVYGSLDIANQRICWNAEVCTTKGRWDSMDRSVDMLEKWEEPEDKKAKEKAKGKGQKAKDSQTSDVSPQTSFADLLRKALLAA